MKRVCIAAFAALLVTAPYIPALHAQSKRSIPSNVFLELLKKASVKPSNARSDFEGAKGRPREFYDIKNVPPDDASDDDLLSYWLYMVAGQADERPVPSSATSNRLLTLCEIKEGCLGYLQYMIPLLPDTPETHERIKELYEDELASPRFGEFWQTHIGDWLRHSTAVYVDKLVVSASKVTDDSPGSHYEDLDALVKQDWTKAEPILKSLASSNQPNSSAMALGVLYKHSIETNYIDQVNSLRSKLKSIVQNKTTSDFARNDAFNVLTETDWEGLDEWYLSLFRDETFAFIRSDRNNYFYPLHGPIAANPDKWIPIVAKLVDSKNTMIHNAAAFSLVPWSYDENRKDALLPLLPWIADPGWAFDPHRGRETVIEHVGRVDVPESVPGLILAVMNDGDKEIKKAAATSLKRYKDRSAIPALRKGLELAEESDRDAFIEGLIASGGLTDEDLAEGLAAYAANISGLTEEDTHGNMMPIVEPASISVSIGMNTFRQQQISDGIVTRALVLLHRAETTDPATANSLRKLIGRLENHGVFVEKIQRVKDGLADAAAITDLIIRQKELQKSVPQDLAALSRTTGGTKGTGLALLGDETAMNSLLSGSDREAQIALLACARLTGAHLSVQSVASLLKSGDERLSFAAERYLQYEDSVEAQQLLLARHPDQAFITGWLPGPEYSSFLSILDLEKMEDGLRDEVKRKDGPDEAFALFQPKEDGPVIVRIKGGIAIATWYENESRYKEHTLTGSELKSLRDYLSTTNLDRLGPVKSSCMEYCWNGEILTLSKKQGRRVYLLGRPAYLQPIAGLVELLANLKNNGDWKLHYFSEAQINGLELLYHNPANPIRSVWKLSTDIRVLIEKEKPKDSNVSVARDEDDDSFLPDDVQRLKAAQLEHARFIWRSFNNGNLIEVVDQPPGYKLFDEADGYVDTGVFHEKFNARRKQASANGFVILARSGGITGLWKVSGNGNLVKVGGKNDYSNPIVTPDGIWVIVALPDNKDGEYGDPYIIERINLQTGQEYRVDIPAAGVFYPISFLAAHRKVLLYRSRGGDTYSGRKSGPTQPEYYLLDAVTGRSEVVRGEFAPLLQDGNRPLQPTAKVDEVWAAIPDAAGNQTKVGRYDLKTFTFQTSMVIPHMTFDSFNLWVDESENKVYVVSEGHLLRLRLKPQN